MYINENKKKYIYYNKRIINLRFIIIISGMQLCNWSKNNINW